jgi:hypothetical protein
MRQRVCTRVCARADAYHTSALKVVLLVCRHLRGIMYCRALWQQQAVSVG